MHRFDIMTTATLRPELLKRTFDSHIENLFGEHHIKNATLNINIDKTGCAESKKKDKLEEILGYLSTIPFKRVNLRVSDEPHFPSAFCWCLGQIGEPLTFNLEDDWELVKKVDFEEMIECFIKDRSLAHLRLSAFNSTEAKRLKTWNKFCPWNGKYYEIPKSLRGTIGWAGHPSLNRTSFLMYFASIIDKTKNPEKQIKGGYKIITNSRFGVFHKQKESAAIHDIGRKWMVKNGFRKQGNKAWFTNWCREESR